MLHKLLFLRARTGDFTHLWMCIRVHLLFIDLVYIQTIVALRHSETYVRNQTHSPSCSQFSLPSCLFSWVPYLGHGTMILLDTHAQSQSYLGPLFPRLINRHPLSLSLHSVSAFPSCSFIVLPFSPSFPLTHDCLLLPLCPHLCLSFPPSLFKLLPELS